MRGPKVGEYYRRYRSDSDGSVVFRVVNTSPPSETLNASVTLVVEFIDNCKVVSGDYPPYRLSEDVMAFRHSYIAPDPGAPLVKKWQKLSPIEVLALVDKDND